MMRVDGAGGQRPEMPQPDRLKKKGRGQAAGSAAGKDSGSPVQSTQFNQTFLDQAQMQITESLDQLMTELTVQGDRLQRSQTFEELKRYKDLVRTFVHKVSHELYQLKEAGNGKTKRGDQVNVIIQKVDERMDALAKSIMGRQARQLNLMERLDEIRGLLMDLYK